MCNSSFGINHTTSIFDESMGWLCMCQGHFGPYLTFMISSLCFIVGTPFHCWSLNVILHKNVKSNVFFPLNITIVELIYCIQSIVDIFSISFPSVTGDRFSNFLIGLSWTFRPLIQVYMCIEQYLAVIHPVTFLKYKSIHYRIALVGIAWLIAVGNSLRLVVTGTFYFKDHLFFIFFCFTVAIISFCCASVLHALKRPGPGDRNTTEVTEKDKVSAVGNKQKRKAFRIISQILVSILVCYLPLLFLYFLNSAKLEKLRYLCEFVPMTLSITATAVLFSPLVRMYSEGNLKPIMCFEELRKQNQS